MLENKVALIYTLFWTCFKYPYCTVCTFCVPLRQYFPLKRRIWNINTKEVYTRSVVPVSKLLLCLIGGIVKSKISEVFKIIHCINYLREQDYNWNGKYWSEDLVTVAELKSLADGNEIGRKNQELGKVLARNFGICRGKSFFVLYNS